MTYYLELMFRFALITVAALALAACQQDDDVAASPAPEDACGAAPLQSIVGEDIADHGELEPDDKLRVIGPDTAVTMDYRADRLNVEYDEAGTITRVYCG
jgi:hypothetical protein